jgi:hypothetical protein
MKTLEIKEFGYYACGVFLGYNSNYHSKRDVHYNNTISFNFIQRGVVTSLTM